MKLVKHVNNVFITIILSLFYIVLIGFSWILHILTTPKPSSSSSSYWELPEKKKLPKQYFSSPY